MSEAEDGRPTSCVDAFISCSQSIADGMLIERASRQDKEFHFQLNQVLVQGLLIAFL